MVIKQNSGTFVTRFAPSPTGYLHLGHALSAITAYRTALENNGRFLLRIEDIDPHRCRPEYEAAIYEDLAWLGLTWETPVRRQSEHLAEYSKALEQLKALGAVYPCFCSRKQVADTGEPTYSGLCRELSPAAIAEHIAGENMPCWRLDAKESAEITGPLFWNDHHAGTTIVKPEDYGDVVVARRDVPTSYHLAVTVDDHMQGITHVIRGLDLFETTSIHRTLQALLGLKTPEYVHHELLLDPRTGRKLSKRDGATSLRSLRLQGRSPEDLLGEAIIGKPGLIRYRKSEDN